MSWVDTAGIIKAKDKEMRIDVVLLVVLLLK